MEALKGKLEWCAAKLEGWSRENFGSLRKSINEKLKELEELYLISKEDGVWTHIRSLEQLK